MKILITGNSGSGKTTLASQLVDRYSLAHLDLDELAWLPVTPPQRRQVADSLVEMNAFADQHS
ncbi:MAG: shikimate kinase, partial [Cyanobacteria bacterium P01_H01_bin.130]